MLGWFKKKHVGPDFSALNSREKVQAAAADGQLVPMLLMPEEFGGPTDGLNVVLRSPVESTVESRPSPPCPGRLRQILLLQTTALEGSPPFRVKHDLQEQHAGHRPPHRTGYGRLYSSLIFGP